MGPMEVKRKSRRKERGAVKSCPLIQDGHHSCGLIAALVTLPDITQNPSVDGVYNLQALPHPHSGVMMMDSDGEAGSFAAAEMAHMHGTYGQHNCKWTGCMGMGGIWGESGHVIVVVYIFKKKLKS